MVFQREIGGITLSSEGGVVLRTIIRSCVDATRPIKSEDVSGGSSLGLDTTAVHGRVNSLRRVNLLVRPRASTKHIPSALKCELCISGLVRGCRVATGRVRGLRNTIKLGVGRLSGVINTITTTFSGVAKLPIVNILPASRAKLMGGVGTILISDRAIVMVVSSGSKVVGGGLLELGCRVSRGSIAHLGGALGRGLSKLALPRVGLTGVVRIRDTIKNGARVLASILRLIRRTISRVSAGRVFIRKLSGVFSFPRCGGVRGIGGVFSTLRGGRGLARLVSTLPRGTRVGIVVNSRVPISTLGRGDILLTPCGISRGLCNMVNIMKPTEVSCSGVVSTLRCFMGRLDSILSRGFKDSSRRALGLLRTTGRKRDVGKGR